jgi:hypothetical protein
MKTTSTDLRVRSLLSAILLTGCAACSLTSWRHEIELDDGQDRQRFEIWLQDPYGDVLWAGFGGDGLLFPLDIVFGTGLGGVQALFDADREIVEGPAGWLLSVLPFVSVTPPARDPDVPDPPRHPSAGGRRLICSGAAS